jgi:L-glutamine-phosphate cytidylyltransferase
MKAIIMAAGKGTRMQAIHGDIPKGTIPIGETSILRNMIGAIKANGINEIIVVGGYKIDLLREHIGNEAKVIFNPLYEHGDDITSMWVSQKYMNEDFLYFHGDAVFSSDFIKNLVQDPRERVMLIEKKECDEEDSKVLINSTTNSVLKVSKKVPVSEAHGEFVGIAKFSGNAVKSFVNSMNHVVEKKGIQNYESEIIQNMIDNGEKVEFVSTEGTPWCEIDFPKDLQYALENKDKFGL